ncbi:hypothetical protein ES703_80467 [subsurface metagenome]
MVAKLALLVLARSTVAMGVSFTVNAGTYQLVSTQGSTTCEIERHFNVVMLSSFDVMQVWFIIISIVILMI